MAFAFFLNSVILFMSEKNLITCASLNMFLMKRQIKQRFFIMKLMKSMKRRLSLLIVAVLLTSQPLAVSASQADLLTEEPDIFTLEADQDITTVEAEQDIMTFDADQANDVALTGIKLSTESLKIGKGEKVNLEVRYTPQNATNREVTWSSSNDSVASVSNTGLVEAKSNGSTTITATSKSGNLKATCSVTVSDQAAPNLKDLDFAGNQEVSAPNNVPLVGGKKFKLDLPKSIPISCVIEDGRIRIGINMKKDQLYSYNSDEKAPNAIKNKSTKEIFEDLEKDLKKASKISASADKWINMVQEKKFDKAAVPGISKDVKFDVLGYAEGKWSDNLDSIEGNLIIRLSGNATVQGQYMVWVVPVTVNCKFSASATLTAKIGYNFKDAKWYGDLKFGASIGIEPYAGVGFGKWFSGGVYGKATTDVKFTLKSSKDPTGLDEWNLGGEVGIKAYVALLEFKKKIVSGSWSLYKRPATQANTLSPDGEIIEETEEYPEYMEEICAVGAISEIDLSEISPDGTILENAYPAANPEIITAGDTTMLLYVKTVLSDNKVNRTDLVYKLYNNETAQFGEIQSVSSNTTADCEPQIYTDKNDIYVAWLDSNRNLSDSDELYKAITSNQIDPEKAMEYLKTFGIRVSKYNRETGSFEDIGTPSWNDSFIYSPEMCMTTEGLNLIWVENTETVPWIKNNDKSEFLTLSSNVIHRSVYSDGVWTEKESITGLDDVSDLSIGNTSSGLEIAYVIDKADGQTLYVRKADGTTDTLTPEGYITTLSYTDVPSLKDRGTILTLNMDGGLYYADSTGINEILPAGTMCGDSDYSVYGERIYYLQDYVTGDTYGRNVAVSVWDAGSGKYGDVFLTHEKGYVDSFSNQTGRLAYLLTDAKFDKNSSEWNTSSSIKMLDSLDYHDIELEDVDYSPAYTYAGMEFPFDMYITNNGTDKVINARYSVSYNGADISGGAIELNILPGDTGVVEKTFVIPDNYTKAGGDFIVSVKMEGDSDPSNDSKSFSLFMANLTVSGASETVGNRQYIVIDVENSGLKDTNATTKVTGEDGQEIFSANNLIKAGDTVTIRKEYTGTKAQLLTVETKGDAEEFYEKNNIDWLNVDDAFYDPVSSEYRLLPGELCRLDLNYFGRYIYGVKWDIEFPDPKQKGCVTLKNGVITAKKAGKAVVKASYGGLVMTFNITVDGTVPATKTISFGKKVLKINAPKSATLTQSTPEKTKTKKINVSIPKELRNADVTLSANILEDKQAFEISGPTFNNADRTKASTASFEITPTGAGASYVIWSAKDKDGNEATTYTKVIVKKNNTDLVVENKEDIEKMKLPVGEGVNLSVITTTGNTDLALPAFSVKGNGFKVSKSGLVIATKPGASGTVTVKLGNKKDEVNVYSQEKTSDNPYLLMSKPFVDITIPKPTAKKNQTVTLKLSTPKKSIPDVVWSIIDYEHQGMELDQTSGKLTVSANAAPGCYTIICKAADDNAGYNTAVCEVTLK